MSTQNSTSATDSSASPNPKSEFDAGAAPSFEAFWLPRALVVAALLSAAIALSPNVADPDLWGHVQYGKDVLQEGLPRTTSYSYTSNGYRWINHENLAEILMAWAAPWGGWALMTGKCLLGLLVVSLVMLTAKRQQAGLIVSCGMGLLVAVNMSYHWSIRPQLMSFVGYAVMLWLLNYSFEGWAGHWWLGSEDKPQYSVRRLRALWWCVPLFFVWANSHGGFVAGLAIFTAYLGLRTLEAWAVYGRDATGLTLRFALMVAAACAATLVNPYGHQLHLWLLASLGQPRPEITEWHPPQFFSSLAIPLWLLLAVFLSALLATKKQRDFTHLAVLALTLWQAMEHQRHIPFFALSVGFWMPRHIHSCLVSWRLSKEQDEAERMPAVMRWAVASGLLLAFGLLGARLYDRLRVVRVELDEFPVSAVRFMSDRDLGGNLMVTFNWAQYVIGAFGPADANPHVRVAFDGRFRTCYPQELVDAHFDFVLGNVGDRLRSRGASSPPFDGARILNYEQHPHGAADLALINRFQPHGELVMLQQRKDWVLLYQDSAAQLWGRRDRYDDPDSALYLPPEERLISDAQQWGYVPWPALPTKPDIQLPGSSS